MLKHDFTKDRYQVTIQVQREKRVRSVRVDHRGRVESARREKYYVTTHSTSVAFRKSASRIKHDPQRKRPATSDFQRVYFNAFSFSFFFTLPRSMELSFFSMLVLYVYIVVHVCISVHKYPRNLLAAKSQFSRIHSRDRVDAAGP